MGKKRFDYALILVESLKHTDGSYCDIRKIAAEHGLPRAYLEKIAQELKRAGWLEASRGMGGGYRIKKQPSEATVTELMNYFDHRQTYCPVSSLTPEMKLR